jgi:hypothetical protein
MRTTPRAICAICRVHRRRGTAVSAHSHQRFSPKPSHGGRVRAAGPRAAPQPTAATACKSQRVATKLKTPRIPMAANFRPRPTPRRAPCRPRLNRTWMSAQAQPVHSTHSLRQQACRNAQCLEISRSALHNLSFHQGRGRAC